MQAPTPGPDDPIPSNWISMAEARRRTGLSRTQIDNLQAAGQLLGRKNADGHWRFEPNRVDQYAVRSKARKASRVSRAAPSSQTSERSAGTHPAGAGTDGVGEAVMRELADLRAKVRALQDELAHEREANEKRWRSEDARDVADKLLERALIASRKVRKRQVEEIRALESRVYTLRGPGHPGDLFGPSGGATDG